VKVFNAGRNFYTWSVIRWGAVQTGAALGLVIAFAIFTPIVHHILPRWLWLVFLVFKVASAASFLAQLAFTFLALRLGYEMRWYIVTDRSLRIRSGVWSVEELTMTFANIQQITVEQGPLQRVLGIANVQVSSAGGGGGKKPGEKKKDGHAGYFEGVEDAESIRDLVLERLRRYRDSGLGDPDDVPTALAAAKQVLEETRLLRTVVTSAGR
jgi:uncharacterized membrane protein YdbT with pleckstrin-like domain